MKLSIDFDIEPLERNKRNQNILRMKIDTHTIPVYFSLDFLRFSVDFDIDIGQ